MRKMAGSSHGVERTKRDIEAPKAHIHLAHFFFRPDEFETRGGVAGGRAGDGTLCSLAAVNEEIVDK